MSLKYRYYAFLIYPESSIPYVEMINKINLLKIPSCISPLHFPDNDTKKPRFHCLFTFDGGKTQESLKNLSDNVNNQPFSWKNLIDNNNLKDEKEVFPYFMGVNSLSAMVRYFLHLDDKFKQQFPNYNVLNFVSKDEEKFNSIVGLNGFNFKDYLERDYNTNIDKQLIDFILLNDVHTYKDLYRKLSEKNNQHLLNYMKKNMYFLSKFIFNNLSCTDNQKVQEIKRINDKYKLLETPYDFAVYSKELENN